MKREGANQIKGVIWVFLGHTNHPPVQKMWWCQQVLIEVDHFGVLGKNATRRTRSSRHDDELFSLRAGMDAFCVSFSVALLRECPLPFHW